MIRGPPKTKKEQAQKKYKATKLPVTSRNAYRNDKPTIVRVGRNPLPPMLSNQLCYTEDIVITLASGAFNSHVFSANGLYDPNITGTGHQPLYFDQLMAIYDHYHVTSSSFEVHIIQVATVDCQLHCGLLVDDDASLAANNWTTMSEQPGCKFTFYNPKVQGHVKLTAGWNSERTFPGDPLAQSKLDGDAGTNPQEQSYFIVGLYDSAVVSTAYMVSVRIKYNCVFSELKSMGGS